MSLASIRTAARLLIVAALAALTAGCFQPMYAEHTDGTPGLREKLMGVEVPPVDKPNASQEARIQVEVRNALAIRKAAHGALDKVSTGIEKLHFNVCLAYIREFSNALGEVLGREGQPTPDLGWAMREAAVILVHLFAPMMPHLAEECWTVLGQPGLISEAHWPQIERDLLVEDTVTLVVQVNGKKRGEVTVASNAQNPEIEAAVLALDAVKQALGGKAVRKVIIVPMRIVNVVG